MFDLQQGIVSPRDGSVNWQTYDYFETLAEAKREARKTRGLWRIVENKVVWQSPAPEAAQ